MPRFLAVLIFFATIAFMFAAAPRTSAQAVGPEAIRSLEYRLDQIDSEHLTERMARVEALLGEVKGNVESTNKLLMGVLSTMAIVAIERLWSRTRRQKIRYYGGGDE